MWSIYLFIMCIKSALVFDTFGTAKMELGCQPAHAPLLNYLGPMKRTATGLSSFCVLCTNHPGKLRNLNEIKSCESSTKGVFTVCVVFALRSSVKQTFITRLRQRTM